MKESNDQSDAMWAVQMFLGAAAFILGCAVLLLLFLSSLILAKSALTWLWYATGN